MQSSSGHAGSVRGEGNGALLCSSWQCHLGKASKVLQVGRAYGFVQHAHAKKHLAEVFEKVNAVFFHRVHHFGKYGLWYAFGIVAGFGKKRKHRANQHDF